MSLSRRDFLKVTGGAAAGLGASLSQPVPAGAATTDVGRATLPYAAKHIGRVGQLKEHTPMAFSYPDNSSPCALLKMGKPVAGGIGPNGDIVAFSTLCTHMGCPVSYDGSAKMFKCPCHFSTFDPEKSGQMIIGQATEDLPKIVLQYNTSNDTVTAVGVEGLIYGRQSNLL